MYLPGFVEGSVYSNQTSVFGLDYYEDINKCQIIDGEIWCQQDGNRWNSYWYGGMFGNQSLVENWPAYDWWSSTENGGSGDYSFLNESYRIDMLPTGTSPVSIHRAGDALCSILNTGNLTCWGSDAGWFDGLNNEEAILNYTPPTLSIPNEDILAVASSSINSVTIQGTPGQVWTDEMEWYSFLCVLTDRVSDNVYCLPNWDEEGEFGDMNNVHGEFGLGYANSTGELNSTLDNYSHVPVDLGGRTATSIDVGDHHVCVIAEDRGLYPDPALAKFNAEVMCWGENANGQLGDGTFSNSADTNNYQSFINPNATTVSSEILPGGLQAPVALALTDRMTCALLLNGEVTCWGGEYFPSWAAPSSLYNVTLQPPNATALSVHATDHNVCTFQLEGLAHCWERDTYQWHTPLGTLDTSAMQTFNMSSNGTAEPLTIQAMNTGSFDSGLVCTLYDNGSSTCFTSTQTSGDQEDEYKHLFHNSTQRHRDALDEGNIAFTERDADGDGFSRIRDLCPSVMGELQGCSADTDGDGLPDVVDDDDDGDGVSNSEDICPGGDDNVDSDSDGTPDDCDADRDGDGTPNVDDAFPDNSTEWDDSDGDGVGDNTDAFPNDPIEWSSDDTDGDGVTDRRDAFPNDPTESADSDDDGVGDNSDAFPNDPSEWLDLDGNGIGDNEDNDDDGDGIPDDIETRGLFTVENCPWRWYAVSELDSATYGANDPHRNFTSWDLLDAPWWRYSGNYRRVVEPATFLGTVEGDEQIKERSITTCDFSYDAFNDQDGDGITLGNYYITYDPGEWNQFGDVDECVQGHNVVVTPVSMLNPRGPERPDNWYYGDSGWDPNAPNEIMWRFHRYCSNPLDPMSNDTDGDGLSDYDEIHTQQLCTSSSHPIPLRTVRWGDQELTQWGRLCHTNPMVADSDGDGVADGEDPFPTDPTQSVDADGDGYGDNMSGSRADLFLGDATDWFDFDGDGIGDNADPDDDNDNLTDIDELENNTNPLDSDTDDDGFIDGNDDCPNHASIGYSNRFGVDEPGWIHSNNPFTGCLDSDYDGYIDDLDECPSVPGTAYILRVGCPDRDGDGYDNMNDEFPLNSTSWADSDKDGVTNDRDACIFYAGTSTIDRYGCPDRDGDGYSDEFDSAPDDPSVFLGEIGYVQRSLESEGTVYGASWDSFDNGYGELPSNTNRNCGLGSDHSIDQNNGIVAVFHSGGNNLSAFVDNTWYTSPTFDASHGWNFGKSVCNTGGGRPQLVVDDGGLVHGLFTANSGSRGLWYVKWDPITDDLLQHRLSINACKSCGIGLDIADGIIHVAWFEGHYRYASSENGEDWNEIKVANGRTYNSGIDVAVGQDGTIHVAFSRSNLQHYNCCVKEINSDPENANDLGLMYTKKEAGASEFEAERALPILAGGSCVMKGGYYPALVCSDIMVVKAPRIVASQDSPAVHVASSTCDPIFDRYQMRDKTVCPFSSHVKMYSTFNGKDWTRSTVGGQFSGGSFDLTLGSVLPTASQSSSPTLGTMREEVHLVYTSVEYGIGGNAETVTYAKMTGINEWKQTNLENANLAGVGITLDETNQPIIIHGYGDYDRLKRSQGKVGIYLTGWDEDGDGFANWEDDCLGEYGILNGCQDLEGDGIIDSLSNSVRENPVGSILVVILVAFGIGVGVGVAVFRTRQEFHEDMFAVDIQESNEPFEQKSVVELPPEEE